MSVIRSLPKLETLLMTIQFAFVCIVDLQQWEKDFWLCKFRLRDLLQWRVLPLQQVAATFHDNEGMFWDSDPAVGADAAARLAADLRARLLDLHGEATHRANELRLRTQLCADKDCQEHTPTPDLEGTWHGSLGMWPDVLALGARLIARNLIPGCYDQLSPLLRNRCI